MGLGTVMLWLADGGLLASTPILPSVLADQVVLGHLPVSLGVLGLIVYAFYYSRRGTHYVQVLRREERRIFQEKYGIELSSGDEKRLTSILFGVIIVIAYK